MERLPDGIAQLDETIEYEGKKLLATRIINESGKAVKESGAKYWSRIDHGHIMIFEEVIEPQAVIESNPV